MSQMSIIKTSNFCPKVSVVARFAASELGDDSGDIEVPIFPIFAQSVFHNFDGALICANETIGKRNIFLRRKGKRAREKHFSEDNLLVARDFQIFIDALALKCNVWLLRFGFVVKKQKSEDRAP